MRNKAKLNEHHCAYKIVRRTVLRGEKVSSWNERCRCGRTIFVEHSFLADDKTVRPVVRKTWFYPNGDFWRTTGMKDNETPAEIDGRNDAKSREITPDSQCYDAKSASPSKSPTQNDA